MNCYRQYGMGTLPHDFPKSVREKACLDSFIDKGRIHLAEPVGNTSDLPSVIFIETWKVEPYY
jgi:hypothetical protein